MALILANALLQPRSNSTQSTWLTSAIDHVRGPSPDPTPRITGWDMEKRGDQWTEHVFGAYDTSPPPPRYVIVRWHCSHENGGLWSQSWQVEHTRLIVFDLSIDANVVVSEAEQIEIITAIHQLDDNRAKPPLRQAGGSTTTRILWLGVLNDLFVLPLFLALGCSLVLNVKRIRRERAQRANRCPTCGYALENLTSPTCPECGKVA